MSEIAYANQEQMFAVVEDLAGELKQPATSDRMYSVGPVDFSQDQEFLDDEQIRATASRLPPIAGRIMPGEFSFDTYVKPSGTVGTEPEHDALFYALMGGGGAGGGGYQYTLANELPSLSIWVKKGHTVFAFRGATIEAADFAVSGDAIALISWSGKYMRQLMAGTAMTVSISGAVLTMEAGACESYSEGMYVVVGSDNNSGVGFKILKVNPAGNKITLADSPSPSGAQLVTPWWEGSETEVGEPAHGKLGKVQIAGKECIILTASVSMVNNIKYYIDEKNDVMTAERYGRPKIREIEGNLNLYFMRRGPSYWYRAEYQVSDALVIPVGKVPGKIMELQIDHAEYRTPKISGDEEFQEDIPFIAVADPTVLNDELKIVFK
jgi:hypothetical protein